MIEGLSASAIRSYDIRGRVPGEIGVEGARALGLAFASAVRGRGLRRIGVGRDGRTSAPELEAALVEGLVAGGAAVVRLGLGPTPLLGFAVHRLGLDGGVQVTGSHNPPDENGFKLSLGGRAVAGAELTALVERPGQAAAGGQVEMVDPRAAYAARLAEAGAGMEGLRVAWDCGHGAAGPVVRALVRLLPGEHHLLFDEPDGTFPAHHPDPSVPANLEPLIEAVRARGCDVGFAFDGDGDRVGAVDGAGRIVWPDQLLLLIAREILARRPGAVVLGDVKSSLALFDGVRAAGGAPVMAPAGYVRLREAMVRAGAAIAGELSGHIFIEDRWIGTDDGLHAAVRVLAALGRLGTTLADFRDGLPQTVTGPEWRFPLVPEDGQGARRAADYVERVAELVEARGGVVDRTDGVRVTGPGGWWLLRASGTESKLTARAEGRDARAYAALTAELEGELSAAGLVVRLS